MNVLEYNNVYSILCFVASILVISLGLLAKVHYKSTSFSKPLSALLFSIGIYAFGYGFEIMKGDLDWVFLWLRVEYLGLSFIAACWLWFSMAFTRRGKYMKWPFFVAVFGISIFFLIAVFTNDSHHLYYTSISINGSGYFEIAHLEKGILYHMHSVWWVSSFLISAILYVRYYFKVKPIFKQQAKIMIIISIEIIICLFIDLSEYAPKGFEDIDTGPLVIAINACICAYVIFKIGILKISPIAREKVFESMEEGVVVTDLEDRIVDYNPMTKMILPEITKWWIGESLLAIFPALNGYSGAYKPLELKPLIIKNGENSDFFEIRKMPINDSQNKMIGTAWYVKEITEQYEIMRRLQEFAEKDALTGIWNRRIWFEKAEATIKKSRLDQTVFSILILDIDFFKKVNDTMGHATGDEVLKIVTKTITDALGKDDIFGRLGGEEFAIVLYDKGKKEGFEISNRLVKLIAEKNLIFKGKTFNVTISAGISTYERGSDETIESLLKVADEGLYKAKRNGRNNIQSI